MSRVLLTGATGFVGQALCVSLARSGYTVRAALRDDARSVAPGVTEKVSVGDIGPSTDWGSALNGVGVVLHLAARVHVLHDRRADAYFDTNAEGTRCLALAAARAGVRRVVFLSSVKVNGEGGAHAYTCEDEPDPQDAYGRSKLLGERYLREIAAASGLEAVIVRPPLVYGPGVRANFLRLMRWVDGGRPFPFGAIHNQRSLVSRENLVDLLVKLVDHPRAPERLWMVSDGEDLSTPELVRRIGESMNRQVRLVSVPVPALRLLGALTGRSAELTRLCSDLRVDIGYTLTELGWMPPQTVNAGIARTVEWYLAEKGRSL